MAPPRGVVGEHLARHPHGTCKPHRQGAGLRAVPEGAGEGLGGQPAVSALADTGQEARRGIWRCWPFSALIAGSFSLGGQVANDIAPPPTPPTNRGAERVALRAVGGAGGRV